MWLITYGAISNNMPKPLNSWLPLDETQVSPRGRWETSAVFESPSEWFSGHFDQCPVVPGIALLALAAETVIKQGSAIGRFLEVSGFSRVRFKDLVLPEEELSISVAPMPAESEAELDFSLTRRGQPIVLGFLRVRERITLEGTDFGTAPV